ncbi:hypothetical protein [Aquibacillus kalidii]|uniref:hypothetical protein n=1 Tax=Aquibacillus kalidii TaxID=2762597 RepID=UPI001647D962|nr:hypothetical protein [Aquibacillus kalidii]
MKWIISALSVVSILIWLAVIWVFLGDKPSNYAQIHSLNNTILTTKDYTSIVELAEKPKEVVPKEITNVKQSIEEDSLKSLGVTEQVSIDTVLSALGIVN